MIKIKANSKFKERISVNSKLCTTKEWVELCNGKKVDLKDESAKKLISYGLAEKINSPKPKKVKEKK